MTRGGGARGRVVRLCAFGTAPAATVALTQVPVSGAFSAVSGNADNSISSAANFCTATPTTLNSSGDTWTDQSSTTANHQNDTEIRVRTSSGGDQYVWTGFSLPAVPTGCQLTQAKLRYYNKDPDSGRNIDVYRGDPAAPLWTAATITWSNQPPYLGPAATNALTTTTAGWQEWGVTSHVLAQYTDGNNGFVLRDRTVNSATSYEQHYYDRQHTTHTPTLVLTWG